MLASEARGRPLRVLLVEDSEDDARLLVHELERGGYEAASRRVTSAEEMRSALLEGPWDVVLSDYHVPRFGAMEALRMWGEHATRAPFIVVSGRVGEDVAAETIKAGAFDFVSKEGLRRLSATVERGLKEAAELERRRRVEDDIRRRDDILEAVRFAAERLLGEDAGWEQSVNDVLRSLGEATCVSRVYVFENFVGDDGEVWDRQTHEWVAPGVPRTMGDPRMQAFSYQAAGLERWMRAHERGEAVYGRTRDLPEGDAIEALGQGIVSLAAVPIFVDGEWWGVVGFDECRVEREWSPAEIGALGAAAGTLGAAIRRRRVEERLRSSETRYRAVVDQATDGIYLLDAGSRRILQTNPSFERMLGYSSGEMDGMTVYEFVAHPRENVDATIDRTLRERRRIVGGREYRRKDGSLVDVEVGVSVISDDGREVICTIVRDVTERNRAAEALARSENRLRTIIETEPECVKVLGPGGELLEMNPAGLAMIEADSLQEVRGKTMYGYVAPEHRDGFVAFTQRVLSGGSGTQEFELTGLKGTRRWFDTHAVPLRDARGEGPALLAITRDITERKRAEEDLRRSEERFKSLAEATFEGVAITLDGRIVETNDTFVRMFGYGPEEVVGMAPLDFTAPESRGTVREAWEAGLEEPYETVCVRKDGTRFDTEIRGRMSVYQGHVVRVTAIRDVTERKVAEEALRQREELYRTVVEQATENIFLVDLETRRVVESNPAFRAALGYSEQELNAMTLYDVVAAPPESVDANIERTIREGRATVGDRRYRRRDGTLLDVEASGSVILLNGRRTLCAVAHDITERARAQKLLEQRVAALTRISADLALDVPAGESLDVFARGAVEASTAVACGIVLMSESVGSLHIFGSYGLPPDYTAGLQEAYRAGADSPSLHAYRTRRPVLVHGIRRALISDSAYAPVHHLLGDVSWDIVYSLPLISRNKALGAAFFCFLPGDEPAEDERVFLRAVADQAALALENTLLFSEVRGKAALEERQRLARELHDSVSQALYGIVLGAKTARSLVEKHPERAADPLDYVVSLADAGLTEMRALIFELRPESLETEGLVPALEKQAAAVRARHDLEVEAALCEEPEASFEVKEAVYRIAQEALHNIVKHARASRVRLDLRCTPDLLSLDVVDDGMGFDSGGEFPGHLGLRSMRERALGLGGTLEVESVPGRGTAIRSRLPVF